MKLYVRPEVAPDVINGSIQRAVRAGKRWRTGVRADIFVREEKPRLLFRAPVVDVESNQCSDGSCFQIIHWSHADRFFDTRETKKHVAAALARLA